MYVDANNISSNSGKDEISNNDCVVLWSGGRQKLSTATPSIIRRGLCVVRHKSKILMIKAAILF